MAILPNKVRPGDTVQASTVNGIIDAISDLAKIAQGKRIYRLHGDGGASAGKTNDNFPFRVKIVSIDCATEFAKVQIQRGQVVSAWVNYTSGALVPLCCLTWGNYTVDTYAADTSEKRNCFLNVPISTSEMSAISITIDEPYYVPKCVMCGATEWQIACFHAGLGSCLDDAGVEKCASCKQYAYTIKLANIAQNENSEFYVYQTWHSDIVFWRLMPYVEIGKTCTCTTC